MIVESFTDIAHRIVWCTLATVDRHGRPRSRVVHPVWETTDDVVIGWVWTRPTPLKRAHLRHHRFVSCTCWDPQHDVAVAECDARWEMDSAERERVWGLVATPAPPLGWDPATIFPGGPTVRKAGLLRLDPWRLSWYRAADMAAGRRPVVWQPMAYADTDEIAAG